MGHGLLNGFLDGFLAGDGVSRICVAALALLLFGLSVAVTAVRLRTRVLVGVPDDPTSLLKKLVRTQGNCAEYTALLALLILALGSAPRPAWVTALMILAVAARALFALGMLTSRTLARPNVVRALGASGTYVAGIGLALALVLA